MASNNPELIFNEDFSEEFWTQVTFKLGGKDKKEIYNWLVKYAGIEEGASLKEQNKRIQALISGNVRDIPDHLKKPIKNFIESKDVVGISANIKKIEDIVSKAVKGGKVDRLAESLAKRIISQKGWDKGSDSYVDNLYRAAMRSLGIPIGSQAKILSMIGRGPLNKQRTAADFKSMALDKALVQLRKAGARSEAAILLSMFLSNHGAGLKFDASGKPTNLRQELRNAKLSDKNVGKLTSLSEDLAIIGRHVATLKSMPKNKGKTPAQLISQAIEDYRKGGVIASRAKGKYADPKLGARPTAFQSEKAPIRLVDKNGKIDLAKVEAVIAKIESDASGLVANYVKARSIAAQITPRMRTEASSRAQRKIENSLKTAAIKEAKAAKEIAFVASRAKAEAAFVQHLSKITVGGKTHKFENAHEAIKWIDKTISDGKSFIASQGKSNFDGAGSVIVRTQVELLGNSLEAFAKVISGLPDEHRSRLLRASKKNGGSAMFPFRIDPRTLKAAVDRANKTSKGEIGFAKPRITRNPDEVSAEQRKNFNKYYADLKKRFGPAITNLIKGGIAADSTYSVRVGKNAQTSNYNDLINHINAFKQNRIRRGAGGFSNFMRQSEAPAGLREKIKLAADARWKDLGSAIRNAQTNPSKENVDKVVSLSEFMSRELTIMHGIYMHLGGSSGDILSGTKNKQIKANFRARLKSATRGTWFSYSPFFMEAVGLKAVRVSEYSSGGAGKFAIKDQAAYDKLQKAAKEAQERAVSLNRELGKSDGKKPVGADASIEERVARIRFLRMSIRSSAAERELKNLEKEMGKLKVYEAADLKGGRIQGLSRRQALAAALHDPEKARKLGIAASADNQTLLGMIGAAQNPSVASGYIKSALTSLRSEFEKIANGTSAKSLGMSGITKGFARSLVSSMSDEAISELSAKAKVGTKGGVKPISPNWWNTKKGDTAWGAMSHLSTAATKMGLGSFVNPDGAANSPHLALQALLGRSAAPTGATDLGMAQRRAQAAKISGKGSVKDKIEEATDAVASAASENVKTEARASGRGGRSSTRTAQAVAAVADEVVASATPRVRRTVAAAAGGSGGSGGGGGGRRNTAPAGGSGDFGVPSAGGPNIKKMQATAVGVAAIMAALGSVQPVPQKKIAEIKSAIKGIAQMMGELSAVSGGKINAKGLASAITAQAKAGAVASGGSGGSGGGTKINLPKGFVVPGSQEYDQQMQNMQQSTQKTSGILGKFADQIKFGFSQQVVGQISQGVGALLGHLQGGVIGFNQQLENSQVAFETLFRNEQDALGSLSGDLGSAKEKAAILIKEIQNFANVTPFRFPELVESARRMRAFGFETKQILPNLQAIGDAVAALGGEDDKLNRITYALGQMKQSGRVYQNDMMQLANAGIAGYELLSRAVIKDMVKAGGVSIKFNGKVIDAAIINQKDAMGKSTENALNAMADLTKAATIIAKKGLKGNELGQYGIQFGKVTKAEFKQVVDLIQNEGPVQAMRILAKRGRLEGKAAANAIIQELGIEFRGGMEALSKTFKGALSTLEDTSQYFVALITKPIYDGIRDAMYQAGLFMQSRAARKMAEGFAATFQSALPAIGGALSDLSTIGEKVVYGFVEVGRTLGEFGKQAGAVGDVVDYFLEGVHAVAEMMRTNLVRGIVVATIALQAMTIALDANPLLFTIAAIIIGIGKLSEIYSSNEFGFRDFVNKYAAPLQQVVKTIQNNLIPIIAKLVSSMSETFGATFLISLQLIIPALNLMLKLLNSLLQVINAIPGAANLAGVALALMAGKKLFGGMLFGKSAVFDKNTGQLVKAASGGAVGGALRAVGGFNSRAAGKIATDDIFQTIGKKGAGAKSISSYVRIQTKAAKDVLARAVEETALTAEQSATALNAFKLKLETLAGSAKNVGELRGAVSGGNILGEAVTATRGAAIVAKSTSETGSLVRLRSLFGELKISAAGISRASGNFLSGVKLFGQAIFRLGSYISLMKGGSFLPGSGFLGAGASAAKGAGGFMKIGANLKNAGGIGGALKSGIKSVGKLGGLFAALGFGADVMSGVDPLRAGARAGGGLAGGVAGATIGSLVLPGIGTAIGGILGSLVGSSAGDIASDLAGVQKEATNVEQDLTQMDEKSRAFAEAIKTGGVNTSVLGENARIASLSYADLMKLSGQFAISVEDLVKYSNSIDLGQMFTSFTSGLNLTKKGMKEYQDYITAIQNQAAAFYTNKFRQAGDVDAAQKAMQYAKAEIALIMSQSELVTSTEQLNSILDQAAGKWGLTKEALASLGIVIGGAATDTTALSDALQKANEKLSAIQKTMSAVQSAFEARVTAVFEKKMAEALEKAKDAFLSTQKVMVDGTEWNLLALKKEIELQDKKNRLLEIEKSIKSATRNVEMARLAQYDASIDPLDAAARMRDAEDAKTEELKRAALERKKISLDEAMSSEPVKLGLQHIDELFQAAKMKFQEGMAEIMRLIEEGKITGDQAVKMIADLYSVTLSEVGVLDANLTEDARNFGDGFLGTWDSTLEKFGKQIDKLKEQLKKVKDLGNQLKAAQDDKTNTNTSDPNSSNSQSMLGGRPYDNWRGIGTPEYAQLAQEYAASLQNLAQRSMTEASVALIANLKNKFTETAAALSAAKNPFGKGDGRYYAWQGARANAITMFAPGGEMFKAQKTAETSASFNNPAAMANAYNVQKAAFAKVRGLFTNAEIPAGFGGYITSKVDLTKYAPINSKYAKGGAVPSKGTYLVGENGPEILKMFPGGGGYVIPNHKLPPNVASIGAQHRAEGGYVGDVSLPAGETRAKSGTGSRISYPWGDIIIDSSIPGPVDLSAVAKGAERAISFAPKGMFGKGKKPVIYIDSDDAFVDTAREEVSLRPTSKTAALARPEARSIHAPGNFLLSQTNNDISGYIAHEIGHLVEYWTNRTSSIASSPLDALLSLVSGRKIGTGVETSKFAASALSKAAGEKLFSPNNEWSMLGGKEWASPTPYGTTNPRELYAEIYRVFSEHKGSIPSNNPKIKNFVSSLAGQQKWNTGKTSTIRSIDAKLGTRFGGTLASIAVDAASMFASGNLNLPNMAMSLGMNALGAIPKIGGPLASAAGLIATAVSGGDMGRAAAGTVGSIIGGSLGSLIPIPGIGTLLGSILGQMAGDFVYTNFINKSSNTKSIPLAAGRSSYNIPISSSSSYSPYGSTTSSKPIVSMPKVVSTGVAVPKKIATPFSGVAGTKMIAMADGGMTIPNVPTLVGERGPEIILPRGIGRVMPNSEVRKLGGPAYGGGHSGEINASVIINNPSVRNDHDIRKLAEEVSRAQSSLLRSAGVGRL
jgi:hypothetical protein